MIVAIADVLAIVIGGTIGYLAKKLIPENWNDIIVKGLGLADIYIGVMGFLEGGNTLIIIMAMVFGAMVGESLKIEQRFDKIAQRAEARFDDGSGKSNFAQGFITASLTMCVGAMVVVGSLNAGLKGDTDLLLTKTTLDGFGAIMFAASMGIGVIFAAVPVFIIEGGLVLLAGIVAPALTTDVVNQMTCVGSLLIVGLGLNLMIDSCKLRLMNYMPAMILPVAICPIYDRIVGLF
ncbi:DUF554 domain-containing protein [Anaerovoracaceae bacterium 42-11]